MAGGFDGLGVIIRRTRTEPHTAQGMVCWVLGIRNPHIVWITYIST